MSSAIYDFQSVEELQQQKDSCRIKIASSDTALNFIQKRHHDQKKICRAQTANHFTVKTVATSQGEGSNAIIKERGTKKQGFGSPTYFSFFSTLPTWLNVKRLKITEKLVQGRREYSELVKIFGI